MAYSNLITERQVKIYIDNKLKDIDLINQKPRFIFENDFVKELITNGIRHEMIIDGE